MKGILPFLFIVSIGLNVFFLTGCTSTKLGRWVHKTCYGDPCLLSQNAYPYQSTPPSSKLPTQSSGDYGKVELERIARLLGIRTNGKTSSDLAADIRYVLDRKADVPSQFNSAAFEKMAKDLNTEEEKAMRDYQQFISDLQGKRVIVIEQEL